MSLGIEIEDSGTDVNPLRPDAPITSSSEKSSTGVGGGGNVLQCNDSGLEFFFFLSKKEDCWNFFGEIEKIVLSVVKGNT